MKKILEVPYFAQNDNLWFGDAPGSVQCCPTSNAMYAAFMKPYIYDAVMASGQYKEFECHYKDNFLDLGYTSYDRGNHDAHTVCLREKYDLNTYWTTQGTIEDIIKAIDSGHPVVRAIDYKSSGHVDIIIGYDDDGLYVNDPYGIRAGTENYYSVVNPGYGETYGKHDHFSWSLCDRLMFDSVGHAWIRLPE